MADPINHDGASTVATVGGKVAKWGLIGALAAAAVGFLGATILAGVVTAIVGQGFILGAGAMLSGGALTWIVGGGSAIAAGWYAGTASAIGGGILGFFKGADQVSRETSAFRAKVTDRMNGRANKEAKLFNDGEVKGLDEGYTLAVADMKPQLQAAREQGRQEGAQMVVQQIQEHMQAEMAAAAQTNNAATAKPHAGEKPAHDVHAKSHDKHAVAKPPVQIGGKVIASCECPDGSKAAAIAEQQVKANEAGHTLAS